jgi:hypothetical protein
LYRVRIHGPLRAIVLVIGVQAAANKARELLLICPST